MTLKTDEWDGLKEAELAHRTTGRDYAMRREAKTHQEMLPQTARPGAKDGQSPTPKEEQTEPWQKSSDKSDALRQQPLSDLINMRDRFLSECFDIESGRRFVIDEADAESRLNLLRQRIDEIHLEMAQRDMGAPNSASRTTQMRPTMRTARPAQELNGRRPVSFPATARAGKSSATDDFVARTEERIATLEKLAEAAEANGAIGDAVQCLMAAQTLDRERRDALADR